MGLSDVFALWILDRDDLGRFMVWKEAKLLTDESLSFLYFSQDKVTFLFIINLKQQRFLILSIK